MQDKNLVHPDAEHLKSYEIQKTEDSDEIETKDQCE